MIDGEIIVIDKVEDDSYGDKGFKKVTDKAGTKFNIKSGQGGALKEKWPLLQEGVAIKLVVGEFNGKPFVKDFTVVKDEFVVQATEKAQTQVKTERNDSIEAQVAFKGMVELIATGMVGVGKKEYLATIEWAMCRLHSVAQIVAKIEVAKGETIKGTKDNQEAPKTAGELFNWIMERDSSIKAPGVWLQAEYGVTAKEILTAGKIEELYTKIKSDKKMVGG